MATAGPANTEQVATRVKSLINNQLKQILKKEGLPVSGAKALLQTRIIDREYSYYLESLPFRSHNTLILLVSSDCHTCAR